MAIHRHYRVRVAAIPAMTSLERKLVHATVLGFALLVALSRVLG
jgi:hypothetical protein